MKSSISKLFVLVTLVSVLAAAFYWNPRLVVASAGTGCLPDVIVTSTDDSGPGTLRQAILDVCAGGVIDFDLLWPTTITLTSGQLLVDKAMRIEGPGANLLSISSGLSFTRVLQNDGDGLYLTGVTIRDGATPFYLGGGGGILNTGILTVTHAIIRDNRADSYIGYVYGGGVANVGGTVMLSHSMLVANTAGIGGGVANNAGSMTIEDCVITGSYGVSGGAVANGGTLIINNSTLAYNQSTSGGSGIMNSDGATLTVNDSVIIGNVAPSDYGFGGGIQNSGSTLILNHSLLSGNSGTSGGGIANYEGTLIIENSTLSGNVASYLGGGIYISDGSDITISNSTLTANEADSGNAIAIYTIVASVIIKNSILTSNTGETCRDNPELIVSLGFNLSDDASCHLIELTDLPNTDPLLGPLADNGGATLTHALLPGSPAIDSGDNANCPTRDQRGVPRPQGAGCDRGAVEAVDIASRLDYAYVMNDGSAGQGRYTLFAGGSFVDEASGGGSWGAPAPDKLWLAYNAGYACDALLLGSVLPTDQVRGLRLCRDGSGARGVWQAVPGTGQ